jgi:hypothetical protein
MKVLVLKLEKRIFRRFSTSSSVSLDIPFIAIRFFFETIDQPENYVGNTPKLGLLYVFSAMVRVILGHSK